MPVATGQVMVGEPSAVDPALAPTSAACVDSECGRGPLPGPAVQVYRVRASHDRMPAAAGAPGPRPLAGPRWPVVASARVALHGSIAGNLLRVTLCIYIYMPVTVASSDSQLHRLMPVADHKPKWSCDRTSPTRVPVATVARVKEPKPARAVPFHNRASTSSVVMNLRTGGSQE